MIAIRDLQIGDFINTENNGVVQITVLSWRAVGYEGGASTPEHCSYIPLTEEILAKNGWEGQTDGTNDFFVSRILPELWHYAGTDYYSYDINTKIKYVHQLQHLLRLCGIEKEIKL